MVTLKHPFNSTKDDGADSTRVRPSNWNAEHTFETAGDGVVLGRAAGAGPGPVQEMSMMFAVLPGMIMAYGGATAPAGWVICNGQELQRDLFPELYTVLGVAFGAGNGVSTFNVPNLQGRVIAGVDNGTPATLTSVSATPTPGSMNPNATTRGAKGGSEFKTIFMNLSGIEVAGGNQKFGGVWQHLDLLTSAFTGIWGKIYGSVRVEGTSNTANSPTLDSIPGGGGGSALDTHSHTMAFDSPQNGTATFSPNVVPETHTTEDSQGRFYGMSILQSDGSVYARESYPGIVVQPTLLIHYIIKT